MNRPAPCPAADEIVAAAPPSRPKFDTLFADPRHLRGDYRLARTAIRRGWIKPEDADAFVERFEQVNPPSDARKPETDYHWRRVRGGVYLILEMAWSNERAERYANPFGWPDPTTGRPRRRWYVSDAPERLDAGEVWAELCVAGSGQEYVDIVRQQEAMRRTDRVHLLSGGNGAVYLQCPRCDAARRHLYFTAAAILCRGCLGLRYRAHAAVRDGERGDS